MNIGEVHSLLREEFPSLQRALAARIDAVLDGAPGVPLHNRDRSPIFFVPCGDESVCFALAQALHAAGFYASASVFPAVARHRAGLRFTLSLHNTFEDIGAFLETLARLCREHGIEGPSQAAIAPRPSGVIPTAGAIEAEVEGTPSARRA